MAVQGNAIGSHIERIEASQCEGDEFARPTFSVEHLRAFKPILSFLNAKDRDILYLVFVSQKRQRDVQEILDRSQPSLCYDIKRIRKRLKFVFYLNSVFDIFIDFVENQPDNFEPFDMQVLTLMFYTSSFTMVAELLSPKPPSPPGSQVRVRYTFDKCLRKLEEAQRWDIYEIFMVVRDNLNLVRRVYRGGPSDESSRDMFVPR